jgi:hypothetical protein
MGPEADDIFASFELNDVNKKKYAIVKDKFDNHLIVRRNVIFERAKFNKHKQEDSENVGNFVTSLYFNRQVSVFNPDDYSVTDHFFTQIIVSTMFR